MYMTLDEIKNSLDPSDTKFIAKSLGYSDDLVRKVLNGARVNDSIVQAAKMVIEGKKSLAEQIAIMCGEDLAA
jgi:hypothetical protein